MADFDALLDALNSTDNGTRKQGENALYALADTSLDALTAALVSTLCNSTSTERKLQAAIQLRLILSRSAQETRARNAAAGAPPPVARLLAMQPATLQGLKAGLLHAFRHEASDGLRRNIAAAAAEVAAQIAGEGCDAWPEVLQAVFDGAGSGDAPRQRSALGLLGQLVEMADMAGPGNGAKAVLKHASIIGTMLQTLLGTATVAPSARVAALGASARLLSSLAGSAPAVAAFQALTPAMVATLEAVFAPGADPEGELAAEALCDLTNIVLDLPLFFRPALASVCGAMVSILSAAGKLADETRGYALEFLVCLAESAGSTVRKVPQLSETVFAQTLALVACYDDADEPLAEWGAVDDKEEDEDAEDGNLHQQGVVALSRYAGAIGAKQAWPLFQRAAAPMLANAGDWRARAAAVTALAQVGAGCARELALQMDAMVRTCEGLLGDAHPRVVHAATRALETLIATYSSLDFLSGADEKSSELAGGMIGGRAGAQAAGAAARAQRAAHKEVKTIQETCGAHLLPALVGATAAGRPLRLRSAAFGALDALLGGSGETALEADVIAAQGPAVLAACAAGLGAFPESFVNARRCVLHCCGSIAVDMDDTFLPHYASIQPALTAIVTGTQVTTNDHAEIRAAAMFALANCMEAVGIDHCTEHALGFLRAVIAMLHTDFVPEDGKSMEACCDVLAKLATLLEGDNFAPFLPAVVPLLVSKVQKQCWATKSPLGLADENGGVQLAGSGAGGGAGGGGGGGGEGTPSSPSSTSVSMAFGGKLLDFEPSILTTKLEALKGLNALVTAVGVECKGFHGLADQLYDILERYVLKVPEAPVKTNEKGLEMATFYGSDLRYLALEGVVGLLRVALADGSPHSSGVSHGQYMLTRILRSIYGENGILGDAANADMQEGLVEQLDMICYLSHESTKPGWNGPPGAEEAMAPVVPGRYPPAVLPLDTVPWVLRRLAAMLGPSMEVRDDIIKSKKENPDSDEKDMEELAEALESEDLFMTRMVDVVGYCVKEHGQSLLQELFADVTLPKGKVIPGFAKAVLAYVDKTSPEQAALRCAALAVTDDLVEFASPGSHQILPSIFPHMLACAAHENAVVRHPAVYGLGLCAQFAREFFEPHCPAALAALRTVITAPDARDEDRESSTDNAVAAMLKIAKFTAGGRPHADMIMGMVLTYLPCEGDAIEARLLSKWMIQGLRTMDPLWVGEGGTRGPNLLVALAKTLMLDDERREASEDYDFTDFVIEDADRAVLAVAASEIKAGAHAQAIMGIVATLPQKMRDVLFGAGF